MKVLRTGLLLSTFLAILLAGCGGGQNGAGGISGAAGGAPPDSFGDASDITGRAPDTTRPVVNSAFPAAGAVSVPINWGVSANFSEKVDAATVVTAFTLKRGATTVPGLVTVRGPSAFLDPSGNLAPSTLHTATISTAAKDLAGNALVSNRTWTFTTGMALDVTPPTVLATIPLNGAGGVPLNTRVSASFAGPVNFTWIGATTFTVRRGATNVPGSFVFQGTTAAFVPTGPLALNTLYTATITTPVPDLAGNRLASNRVWTFNTGLPLINLGRAGPFNVLAGSTVTNADTRAAPTTMNGLVGVFPGTAVTGFPTPAVPVAQIHAGDPVANLAKVDLLAAYGQAVALAGSTISLPGNLGGLTLGPGLYANSSTTGIVGTGANAILRLDAGGNSGAIWVFQIGSTLSTDPSTSVVLANGAQARNIFWQVGSSATLGTNSVFKGNILAAVSITVPFGASLQGRALAQSGAVTLDTNTITLP